MYARVATVQGQTDRLEEGIRTFREQIVPAAQQRAGFAGGYLLVDRPSGKALSISLWDSEEALRQSEQTADQQRGQVIQQLGASEPAVERYQVAFTEGELKGQAARVTTGEGMAESMETGLRYVREQVLPAVKAAPGFRGMLHLVNPQAGKVLGVAFVDSLEALRQSSANAEQLRAGAARAGVGGTRSAIDYEVAMHT